MSGNKDNNGVQVLYGVLYTDGVTPIPIAINASNGALMFTDGDTGTNPAIGKSPVGPNGEKMLMITSKDDPKVMWPVLVTADGKILVKST